MWGNQLSKHQIRGSFAVSAAGLQARGSRKWSNYFFSQTPVPVRQPHFGLPRKPCHAPTSQVSPHRKAAAVAVRRLQTVNRKTDAIHRHHPEGVVYRSFHLNSSTFAVSEVVSRRWWCIESLFLVSSRRTKRPVWKPTSRSDEGGELTPAACYPRDVGRPSCGYPLFQGAPIRCSGEILVKFRLHSDAIPAKFGRNSGGACETAGNSQQKHSSAFPHRGIGQHYDDSYDAYHYVYCAYDKYFVIQYSIVHYSLQYVTQ